MGRRPHVRGMVMNPVDHPMGGGQGKSKGGGGRQHPVSPWGQPSKGLKTRHEVQALQQIYRAAPPEQETLIFYVPVPSKKVPSLTITSW